MLWYTIASLTPAALLTLASLWGSPFVLLAFLSITVLVFAMDKAPFPDMETVESGHVLSVALAVVHMFLLFLGIWAIGAGSHLGTLEKLALFLGLSLFAGQISNANAHELIHAPGRLQRRLGTAVYVSLFHGHHVSAHLRVHHVHAATDADPNSAPQGEGYWAFAYRVLKTEFGAGLKAETAHRARAKGPLPHHPYLTYVGGGILCLALSYLIAGTKGVLIHLLIALYAQLQLLLSDYVQHYGLRRRFDATGKLEPMGPHHSWNAPQWYSSAMLLNAPKHSDHHLHPTRPFPTLKVLPKTMPVLPHALPVMGALALIPPIWRRKMDHRVKKWQDLPPGPPHKRSVTN